jgi:hypothetical protein
MSTLSILYLHNNVGVPLPPPPANPPTLSDIYHAAVYIKRLTMTTCKLSILPQVSLWPNLYIDTGQPLQATKEEIGAAEVYKANLINQYILESDGPERLTITTNKLSILP